MNTLPTVADIKQKAALAGTRAHTYWASVVAPTIPAMPSYDRQTMYTRAYMVSMNIIPVSIVSATLLPALLEKPHRSTIEWNTLTRTYGVDRRYIATAYLRGVERILETPSTNTEAHKERLTQRIASINATVQAAIVSICASGIMDRDYIVELIRTGQFNNTLGPFDPDRLLEVTERIAQRQARHDEGRKAMATRYPAHVTWARWRAERVERINAKADAITKQLLTTVRSNPSASPLKLLAFLLTTATGKRPHVEAVALYARKHLAQRLSKPLMDVIEAHAEYYIAAAAANRER